MSNIISLEGRYEVILVLELQVNLEDMSKSDPEINIQGQATGYVYFMSLLTSATYFN